MGGKGMGEGGTWHLAPGGTWHLAPGTWGPGTWHLAPGTWHLATETMDGRVASGML